MRRMEDEERQKCHMDVTHQALNSLDENNWPFFMVVPLSESGFEINIWPGNQKGPPKRVKVAPNQTLFFKADQLHSGCLMTKTAANVPYHRPDAYDLRLHLRFDTDASSKTRMLQTKIEYKTAEAGGKSDSSYRHR